MNTMPKLKIEMLPVDALNEYEGNARQQQRRQQQRRQQQRRQQQRRQQQRRLSLNASMFGNYQRESSRS